MACGAQRVLAGSRWPISSGSRRRAVASAVRLAQRVVVTMPSASTPAPQPVTIHQPTWLAAARLVASGPCKREVTADPTTATPSDWPICRLVEATAAATPACDRGMPDTALLVIGVLTRPKPAPNST